MIIFGMASLYQFNDETAFCRQFKWGIMITSVSEAAKNGFWLKFVLQLDLPCCCCCSCLCCCCSFHWLTLQWLVCWNPAQSIELSRHSMLFWCVPGRYEADNIWHRINNSEKKINQYHLLLLFFVVPPLIIIPLCCSKNSSQGVLSSFLLLPLLSFWLSFPLVVKLEEMWSQVRGGAGSKMFHLLSGSSCRSDDGAMRN